MTTGGGMNDASSRRTATTSERKITSMCPHQPTCPSADSADREAAHLVAAYPEQGWSLLCNGVLCFEDTGELLPDGQIIAPHRALGTDQVVTAA